MTPQKQCPYWKRIIFSPNEYQCTRPVPQQQQEYEFICECCKNACRVTMKNAIPPDCGCLVNSDIGAMWVRRSGPAPSPEIQVISVEPHPYAKELKAIENYIYSSMNHTDEWNAAEQAYQNILSRPAPSPVDADDLEVLRLMRIKYQKKGGDAFSVLDFIESLEIEIEDLRERESLRTEGGDE